MVEEIEKYKIERKVFDKRTLAAIHKLMNKGVIKTVESEVKEGKESVTFSAKDKDENWLSLKIYRTGHCDFKNMWRYLVSDQRFSDIRKGRRSIVCNWCKREFKNLMIARKAGVTCPNPIAFEENVLVASFIGEGGRAFPRLIDVNLEQEDARTVYNLILMEMKKLGKAGLIHSDLSPYNILLFEKPYIIDFSQAVTPKHPLAKEFLKRDVENINNYFKKIGVKVKDSNKLLDNLSNLMGLT